MIDDRYKILVREGAITAELLTSGLEVLRKIHLNTAFYYQSFYSLSMGLERLMKLILHIEQPSLNPFRLGHKLEVLANELNIGFENNSIEETLLTFLSGFAKGNRYTIIDFLHDNDGNRLSKEPVISFYRDIITPILKLHPQKRALSITDVDDIFMVLRVREDLQEIKLFSEATAHDQAIEHAAKYATMYMARVIAPFKKRLQALEGNPNPYFSELFRYLFDDDNYYLTRKTYRA